MQPCNTSTLGKIVIAVGIASPMHSRAGRPLRSSTFRSNPSWTATDARRDAAQEIGDDFPNRVVVSAKKPASFARG
jgi:hypothetical protein